MKPVLKAPGTKRLKLKCDLLLSTSAFKFNMRRYTKAAAMAEACRGFPKSGSVPSSNGEHLKGLLARSMASSSGAAYGAEAAAAAAAAAEVGLLSHTCLSLCIGLEPTRPTR